MRVLFLVLCSISVLRAENTVRLRPLLEEALRVNPEVQAAQKKYEAARTRPQQATALPETMFSLGYSSAGNPLPGAGIGTEPTANAGLMVTQELPYPGKRRLRGAIAEREAEAEFQQYQAAQLSVMSRVKTAWQRLVSNYDMLALLEHTRDVVREMLRVTEARYAAGSAAQQDLFKAQTQISALELRMERLRQEIRSREAELNALLARAPGTPLGRPEPMRSPELKTTPEELLKAAQANAPVLRRARKMIERGEVSVNLARKEFYPDYAVSGGYFYMGSMPAMYQVRVDVKLPLFSRGKARAGVAEQVAELSAARRGYEAEEENAAYRIQDDFQIAETSRKLLRMYQDTVIPQARLTLESSLPSYSTGKIDFLALLNNAMALLEYEGSTIEEVQNYHLALIRLEEMTGVELLEAGQ